MRRARRLAAATALAFLSLAPAALAQKVLLAQPAAPDDVLAEAFHRLRAELAVQGFEIVVVQLEASADSPEKLTELAQAQGAFAGISLTRRVGAAAADVCIADRVTGKISLRTVALDRGRDAPSVLAIRTADLLRASLREFADKKPPPEVVGVDSAPVPKEVQRFAMTSEQRFQLDVRAAAVGLTQRLGPGFAPSLGLGYRAFDRVGFGLVLTGPAFGAAYEASGGTAIVHQELGIARAWVIAVRSGAFELQPALEAGLYRMDATGEVTPPLAPRSGHVTSVALGVGVDASYHFGQRLVLGVELAAFGLTRRPAVAVLGEEYRFAFPLVDASAGLGVTF